MTTTAQCDSCGDIDVVVIEVRRIYLVDIDTGGDTASMAPSATADEPAPVERWCEVCCLHYPHETC